MPDNESLFTKTIMVYIGSTKYMEQVNQSHDDQSYAGQYVMTIMYNRTAGMQFAEIKYRNQGVNPLNAVYVPGVLRFIKNHVMNFGNGQWLDFVFYDSETFASRLYDGVDMLGKFTLRVYPDAGCTLLFDTSSEIFNVK